MKIKIDMKKTYKITLPKGANIDTVETNDNNGVLEVTVDFEKKYVPKDGDIVTNSIGVIAIYAGTNVIEGIKTYTALYEGRLDTDFKLVGWGDISDFYPATKAEKRRLFDALAKYGKRWNAEKKRIEDLPRWRAKYDFPYYYVSTMCTIEETRELFVDVDSIFYKKGNYFRTREAAEKVAEQIRDIFKNSKAE